MRADMKGFVRVRVRGDGAERFFSLCVNRGFLLWNLQARDGSIFVNILVEDFKNAKDLVKKTGVKVAIVKRTGLPFFMSKLCKRFMFAIGGIMFIITIYVSTKMLWHIELQGNYYISRDVFFSFLEEEGIHKGMWIQDLDIEYLEKEIRKKFDLVTWTSGKMDGTILILDIKENEKSNIDSSKATSFMKEEATGLYATVDGSIYSIYTRKGMPLVKKGAEIVQGDLLVDGRVPIYLEDFTVGGYQCYDVDADVFIDTQIEVELQLPKVYIDRIYTGREKQGYYFYAFDKIYPITWDFTRYSYQERYLEQIKGYTGQNFSIAVGKLNLKEYQGIEKNYTQEEAINILEANLAKKMTELEEKGVQILGKNGTIKSTIGNWTLQVILDVRAPAVEKLPIEVPMTLEDMNDRE